MRKLAAGAVLAALVCAVLVLGQALAVRAYDENTVDFKGTVFAVDNDASGKVVAVSILDPAGDEYFVVNDEVGKQLLTLVDQNIKVSGVINVAADGKKWVKVKKFAIYAS
ncbi:MAG: hypothetical protein V1797_04670 [Pseudomonadota bacterium]